jgi:hypothetical protein
MAQRVQRIGVPALLLQIPAMALEMAMHHWRPDEARMDGIDPDAVARVQQRVGLAHQAHGALGGVVWRQIGRTDQPVDRPQVDDAAAAVLVQMRQRVPVQKNTPLTLTACTLSYSCSVSSWVGLSGPGTPALLTSTSMCRNLVAAASIAAATSCPEATSACR